MPSPEALMAIRVWFFLLALGGAASGIAQSALTRDTFFEMESVGGVQISPDGQLLVFTRTWVDKLKDVSVSNVWMSDVEGKKVRQLTEGNWRDSSPAFSPDGKRLAFLSDRDGTTQLYVMWLDTREVAKLTNLERSPGAPVWSPDGTKIAYSTFVPALESPLAIRMPERPQGAQWARGATIENRLSWAADGSGYRPIGWTQVFVVDARLGGTPRQVTDGDYNHSNPQWSADGRTIFVSGIRKPDAEYLRGDSEIYAFDLESKSPEQLTDRKGPDGGQRVSPDGKWIAYVGFDEKNYTSHLSSLYLMDVKGGSKRMLAGNLASSPSDVTWAWDSSGVFYTVGEKGVTVLYFSDIQGKTTTVLSGQHDLSGFSLARNGTAATSLSSWNQPGSVFTFDSRRASNSLRKVVDVNEDVMAGKQLSEIEELWFTSADGLKVQGWLVKPVGFDASKKYPLVLWIHGGPWSMYDVGWSWAFQNWAAEGYAVLFTNPRGSTGYGQEFVNGIQFSYPGKDYDDLMAGVDAALAKGWIDEKNLFVCGGSGGGVLTAWIVGHTNRFAAACAMRPVINWHSFVGTTDGASWYYQFEKYPWQDPVEYAKRSPLSYVENVQTPILIMTGEEDLRTPISQSEEYYRALKMLKKETLLIRMPEEYHGWRRPSHQLTQQLYLMAWFSQHKR
ncbi:MAG: S9 family peptidase [Armatimonadetes bacterium]|nr:S9 family peptidase [Armatimonadota bacterium]NOG92412.1 S9 family peptidase [Armatimonadota bacterium]